MKANENELKKALTQISDVKDSVNKVQNSVNTQVTEVKTSVNKIESSMDKLTTEVQALKEAEVRVETQIEAYHGV